MMLRISLVIMVFWIPVEEWLSKDLQIIPQWVTWLDEGLLALITIEWIVRMLLVSKKYHRTPLDFPLIAFLLVGVFSALINQVPLLSVLFGFRAPLQYVLLYYAIINSRIGESFFRKLMMISAFFALLQVPFGIYQVIMKAPLPGSNNVYNLGIVGRSVRVFGTFAHPNALGGFLMVFIAVFAGWYWFTPKIQSKYRIGLLIAIGLMLIVLILTFSREAWLALFVGVVVVLWFQNRNVKALTIIVVSAVVLGMVWQLVPGFKERTLSQVKTIDDYVRYRNMLVAAQLIKANPIFGVGPGMWGGSAAVLLGSPMMEKYPPLTATADSNWLSMTVEFGILGSCIFLGLLFAVFRRTLKYLYKARPAYKTGDSFKRGVFMGASVSIVGFALLALVSPAFENQQISFYVWFFAGASQTLRFRSTDDLNG